MFHSSLFYFFSLSLASLFFVSPCYSLLSFFFLYQIYCRVTCKATQLYLVGRGSEAPIFVFFIFRKSEFSVWLHKAKAFYADWDLRVWKQKKRKEEEQEALYMCRCLMCLCACACVYIRVWFAAVHVWQCSIAFITEFCTKKKKKKKLQYTSHIYLYTLLQTACFFIFIFSLQSTLLYINYCDKKMKYTLNETLYCIVHNAKYIYLTCA